VLLPALAGLGATTMREDVIANAAIMYSNRCLVQASKPHRAIEQLSLWKRGPGRGRVGTR